MNANSRQVGGSHYQSAYQHWDMVEDHNVGYLEANAGKYLVRWRKKGGIQDLEKARHYLVKLMERVKANRRTNRGFVQHHDMIRYLQSNEGLMNCNMVTWEGRVIIYLCQWDKPEDLEMALMILNEGIDEAIAEDMLRQNEILRKPLTAAE